MAMITRLSRANLLLTCVEQARTVLPQCRKLCLCSSSHHRSFRLEHCFQSHVGILGASSTSPGIQRIHTHCADTRLSANHAFNSASPIRTFTKTAVAHMASDPLPDQAETGSKTRRPVLDVLYEQVVAKGRPMQESDWAELAQDMASMMHKNWPTLMLDLMATHADPSLFESAESLYDFACKRQDRPNLVLLVLRVLLDANQGKEQQMMGNYEKVSAVTDAFDNFLATRLVMAFTRTSHWKESYRFLEMAKKFRFGDTQIYHLTAAAAFRNGAMEEGWDLVAEVTSAADQPAPVVFEALMELHDKSPMFQMLSVMERQRWIPSYDIAFRIRQWFEYDMKPEWLCSSTRVERGYCENCGDRMEDLRQVKPRDMPALREAFLEKAIQRGGNIYMTTSPEELQHFQGFLHSAKPYDVVVDGLNVASLGVSKSRPDKRNLRARSLRKVVEYLTFELKKRVLIIGKLHMKKGWPHKDMMMMRQIAQMYLAENDSADDVFLLYAALCSNIDNTYLVTSDHLRDHRVLLGSEQAEAFRTWQRGHQAFCLGLNNRGKGHVMMEWPDKYETSVQRTESGWHIPYDDQVVRASHQPTKAWLCITKRRA